MALSFNGKSKPAKKPVETPTPVVDDKEQDDDYLQSIAKPLKSPPKTLPPFKSKRDALKAMATYGATRSTYDSKGRLVPTANEKSIVS